MTDKNGQEQGSVEATRAALHMRDARAESQEALDSVDRAIDRVRELLRRGENDGQ